MITELAEERGIDLNSLDMESAKDENHRLVILLHLDRLRRKAEQEFPNARNFIDLDLIVNYLTARQGD
jgi:hypothetical protein